jgi:metal-responsive CopG/Arc/MetJ family transcriptional regulator
MYAASGKARDTMKRTSIFLEEQLLRKLQRAAERQGVSAATLVREAVTRYLAGPEQGSRLPPIAGQFTSGTSDTAERVDELLWTDPHG